MKLHEYQSKQIFAKYGVPIPKGRVASTASEARHIAAFIADSKQVTEKLMEQWVKDFNAKKIITYTELLESKRKYVVAKQLCKSGTSIAANIWEAQSAESKADFIHKVKISSKEIFETEYWLLLCKDSESYPDPGDLLDELQSLKRISGKIIATGKKH